ncbi:MAG: PQQ-binding-like beta-propeller repeat protein, partial [Planctomycetota bacterium]
MRFAQRIVGLLVLVPGAALAEDWPQFRGGAALSQASFAKVPLEWTAGKNVAWRTAIPGSGWSQPIVTGGRIIVTTAVSPSGSRPSGMMGGVMSLSTWGMGSAPSEPIQFRVLCLDAADGKILWSKTVADVKPAFGKHTSNTFATETPCAAADSIYTFFGATGTVVALDRDGNDRWRRDLGAQPTTNQFGTGSSPLFHQDSQGRG